jgi:starch phosphorylase
MQDEMSGFLPAGVLSEFTRAERFAYFSMEIALENSIPTYSGGLGGLAGDTLSSAADIGLPLVGVTLVSRAGYFRQKLDELGRQSEAPELWQPEKRATLLGATVAIHLSGRVVWIQGWIYVLQGRAGGRVPVILLDTSVPQNATEDQGITDSRYGGDAEYRLKQEIVLGLGGVRLLRALGFRIRHYHMNEGHSAFLTAELMNMHRYEAADLHPNESPYDVPRVRSMCNFTTHTPVEAGHDRFPYDLVARVLDDGIDIAMLKQYAGAGVLNMTELALGFSGYVNGVAKQHASISRQLFPGHEVHAITNGVHPQRWTAEPWARLFEDLIPGWSHAPEMLNRADRLPDDRMIEAHRQCKALLLQHVQKSVGIILNPELPVLGFARRMTGYKRPQLLFQDLGRLRAIAARTPFQVVMAGKAHPQDWHGKQLIEDLHRIKQQLAQEIPVVFLPGYDMELSRLMVSGCDIWLNTPLRPYEASGTSGMKAAFNGVPQLSVLDGWWMEGCIEGVTGWSIGDGSVSSNGADAEALYCKIEHVVLPLWHEGAGRSVAWVAVMKGAIARNASYFNSHRMLRRYATEVYVR